ncbi:hypothetical protein [Flavobacterium sp. 7A]|uniref:hypothetical protein n=1 Tax=Flavobacterium sp. 7A TaxID=2940571 RepID=UPI002227E148|nr:hypothetical protein [Flavobacterium sp. 7A]MCW2120699.1 hypothetical protein [Flavobacterium sp. 7A]
MKKYILLFMVFFVTHLVAQEIPPSDKDKPLKEKIYAANKKKVMNFSKKQFDTLFFEFFKKKNNIDKILTKEEFYNYTIQISIYSDRLAALYPEEKVIALENKKKWMAEDYEDYLKFIKSKINN